VNDLVWSLGGKERAQRVRVSNVALDESKGRRLADLARLARLRAGE